jgi:hypothetical protein
MTGVVWFFGGNGHSSVRLEAARRALARRPDAPHLVEVPYPGFEGRRRAESLEAFLTEVAGFCRARAAEAVGSYATGIGALVALGLRARGELPHPLIFQGPVLWGLERRMFPALMRSRLARKLLRWTLSHPWCQGWFARGLFLRPPDRATRGRFFEGYARCQAFDDLFAWLTPAWLRVLESQLSERPEALGEVTVWTGGRDHVVGMKELHATERALGVHWPVVEFPHWGHYPMVDVPEEWASALCHAVAAA